MVASRTCSVAAWAVAIISAAGCGGSKSPAIVDAGSDGTSTLSLEIALVPPTLAGLVVTGGELELDGVSLVGDSGVARAQGDEAELAFVESSARSFSFSTAAPGLYSGFQAQIDHVSIVGTYNGTPLHIQTEEDERNVDLRGPDQEYSASQSARFRLSINGASWLTQQALDSVPLTAGMIQIDEQTTPAVVDSIMSMVVASFSLTN